MLLRVEGGLGHWVMGGASVEGRAGSNSGLTWAPLLSELGRCVGGSRGVVGLPLAMGS